MRGGGGGGEERTLPSRSLQVEGAVMARGLERDEENERNRGRMREGRERNGNFVVGRGSWSPREASGAQLRDNHALLRKQWLKI